MYRDLKIGVVVPAYNEEVLIGKVIETMPDYVDKIIVIDDNSRDRTCEIVLEYQTKFGERIDLIQHTKNTGVGGAICDGYQHAYDIGLDAVGVMAGDAQMDPKELAKLLDPIVEKDADYVKGNRLFYEELWATMPRHRVIGNSIFTLLTKIASGYWHITDAQGGYTTISRYALECMELQKIGRGYEFENSILIHLNVNSLPVVNVPVRPIYGVGEKSGIRFATGVHIARYLLGAFLWRLWHKYVIRDTHPLFAFYITGLMITPIGFILGLYLVGYRLLVGPVAVTSTLLAALLILIGWQFLLFAMLFDMQDSKSHRR